MERPQEAQRELCLELPLQASVSPLYQRSQKPRPYGAVVRLREENYEGLYKC